MQEPLVLLHLWVRVATRRRMNEDKDKEEEGKERRLGEVEGEEISLKNFMRSSLRGENSSG